MEIKVKQVISDKDFFDTKENDIHSFEFHKINKLNWKESYPYAPDVKFIIGHNNKEVFLRFFVHEQSVLAKVTENNGEVWTDSCVEFFISFDDTGYYNFEFNCIGTMLLGFRKEKDKCTHAGKEIIDAIERYASLGVIPFQEKHEDTSWELAVKIPIKSFFKHSLTSLSALKAKANFYKCGDNMSVPHFLSWNAIHNPTPNFHLEKYFGDIDFE